MPNFIKLRVRPNLPEQLAHLKKLSYNLWTTWDKDASLLFRRMDPHLYRQCDHNPVKLLHLLPKERLEELANDRGFIFEMNRVWEKFLSYRQFTGYYHDEDGTEHDFRKDQLIAYFSMEYGLHESIPAYSGGLGVLAGDYLKAASDQGIPLIAFGLLYKFGYFSQKINLDGMQEENYSLIEWHTKPVRLLRDENGETLLNSINILNRDVWFKTWIIEVGTISLYLLDTDIDKNPPDLREITDILYPADKDKRITQEILLAFGSLKLMESLEINPSIYHLNEGHSAFLIVERLRKLMNDFTYREAQEIIYQSTVFTTHTPVVEGNEHFERGLIETYLRKHIEGFGFNFEEFYKLGAINHDEYFWLPAFAMRFSRYSNGVSKLHSQVSRKMWHKLYPDICEQEVPISAITNGVHIQSWISEQVTSLFDRYIGPDYMHMAEKRSVWRNVKTIPNSEIWEAHQQRKEQMISFIRTRVEQHLAGKGQLFYTYHQTRNLLNPDHLTIGFARRFAPYKRADLILEDPKRLLEILNHPTRPVQFLFAGKAHPADQNGKLLIKRLIDFAKDNKVEDRFVFIEDYDINIARHMVQGVDVWLNNPIRPLEASGTSGMKAGMNGVLNLSVLDGWWPECFDKRNGWAIRAGEDFHDERMRRRMEANQVYELIENEVSEMYYDRDQTNIPIRWVEWMKHSMYTVGMGFNMHRMLRQYEDEFYAPGILAVQNLSANDFENLRAELKFEDKIRKNWNKIRFTKFHILNEMKEAPNTGDTLDLEAIIDFGAADADDFLVEVIYIHRKPNGYRLIPMELDRREESGIGIFRSKVVLKDAGTQYINARVRPKSKALDKFYFDMVKWFE